MSLQSLLLTFLSFIYISNAYIAISSPMNRSNAQDQCQTVYGSDLATIDSPEEQTLAENECASKCDQLSSCSLGCWIGLYQTTPDISANYFWEDSTEINYGFNMSNVVHPPWAIGQPGTNAEICTVLWSKSSGSPSFSIRDYLWADYLCWSSHDTIPLCNDPPPSAAPTLSPSITPSSSPSFAPTPNTLQPSNSPTPGPLDYPTLTPISSTDYPTIIPTITPTIYSTLDDKNEEQENVTFVAEYGLIIFIALAVIVVLFCIFGLICLWKVNKRNKAELKSNAIRSAAGNIPITMTPSMVALKGNTNTPNMIPLDVSKNMKRIDISTDAIDAPLPDSPKDDNDIDDLFGVNAPTRDRQSTTKDITRGFIGDNTMNETDDGNVNEYQLTKTLSIPITIQ